MYIDRWPGQTCHSKDGGSAYSIGIGKLGWWCGTGLKSYGTLTDWCTGREWPVNCRTVIFAWWRSSMPFQGPAEVTHPDGQSWGDIEWVIELLYNLVKTGSQLVWRPDPLVTRCGRKNSTQRRGPPVKENENDTWLCPEGLGRSICCSLCSVSNSLSHATLSIKGEVYFSKRTVSFVVFIIVSLWFCMHMYMYYVFV